jgi:iron-sulfur cluster repair protein YtfE (RIC family)
MNFAELMAAMNTVEEDHRLVLDRVQALKEAVSCLHDPRNVDCKRVLAKLRDLNTFFATQFVRHLEEEETTLFPFLERRNAENANLVGRLRLDHQEIRRRREEFSNCLDLAIELENGLTTMVLRDLCLYGFELWEILNNHAHAETQAVRECVARAL